MSAKRITKTRGLIQWLALLALPLGLVLAQTVTVEAATVVNDKSPISGPFTNPCNGEPIIFSGNVHTIIQATADSSGGFHVDLSVNYQGVSGVAPSGTTYSFPLTLHDNFTFISGATEHTFTEHVGVVSHGSAPDFVSIEVIHMTIDANGNVTSFDRHFDAACRG